MVYETFLNTIRVLIQEKLGDSCEVRPVKVLKNNGTVLDGLTILSGSFPAAPTIYLNDLYKLHLQGTGLHIIAETILRSIADSPVPPPDTVKQFTDYNLVRKKLAIRLLHAEKNKKLLSELPWFPVLDLALVFSIVVRTDTGDLYSCLVTESHLNRWRITPAYDLTYSDTYWGEQTTSVNGKGKGISDKDLVKVGTDAGLKRSFCVDRLKEIREKIGVLGQYVGGQKYHRTAKIPLERRIKEIWD